jgi:arylsulfatase A-like enzyme
MTGAGAQEPPRDLYWTRREGNPRYQGKTIDAVRSGDWKLVHNSPFGPLELFNLADDPYEQRDLAATRHDKFDELARKLRLFIQESGRTPWQNP